MEDVFRKESNINRKNEISVNQTNKKKKVLHTTHGDPYVFYQDSLCVRL